MPQKWPILLFLLLSPAHFSAQKRVYVATLADYATLLFSVDNQVISCTFQPGEDNPLFLGYSWDIFRERFHIMGYTIQLKVEPWARALKEFSAGEVDFFLRVRMRQGEQNSIIQLFTEHDQ